MLPLPNEADLAGHEESDSDRRVDVSAADVRNHPDDSRYAEAERQGDPNDFTWGARTAADEHQQTCADELGQNRRPELGRLHLLAGHRRRRKSAPSCKPIIAQCYQNGYTN